jgi:outer membrane receptor protein involved in Fe transport
MRNYKYHRVTGVAAATTALAIAAGAVPSSDVRAADAQVGALEEIIVTASKRQESVLDLPISVSAIDAQQLERKGVKDLEELSRSVPGLAITPAAENEPKRFVLRGIGPAFGTAATVAVYVDDTPITIGTNSPDLKLFDVERVEVLRGPQGTLFGSSAMGGAIRYVAPQPSLDEFGGSAKVETSATAEGGQNYEAQAALGGPLSENLAFRVSGFYRKDGGYIDVVDEVSGDVSDEDANAADSMGGRLALRLRLGDAVDATLSVLYQDQDYDDLSFFHSLRGMSDPPIALGELQKTERVDVALEDRLVLPNLLVKADLGFAELTSSTSVQRQRIDLLNDLSYFIQGLFGLPGSDLAVPSDRTRHFDAFAQELRLASDREGAFTWLIGLYYRETKSTNSQVIGSNINTVLGVPDDQFLPDAPGAIETLEETFRGNERAIFGEASYNFTPALKLTAGVRYSSLERDVKQVETFAPLLGGGAAVVDPPASNEHPFTPKLSLSYEVAEDAMVYATAAKGFREGGPNPPLLLVQSCLDSLASFGLSGPPLTYESDNLWSYELGTKFQTDDRRLRFQGAVFQIDWSDIQQTIPVGQTCGSSPNVNFGEARVRGVESELSWRALDSLTIDLSGAYTNAEITEDLVPLNVQAGTPLSGVPEWTVSLSAQNDFVFSNGWEGYLRAEYQYVGDANRFLDTGGGQPDLQRGAYEVVALRTGLSVGAYEFSLFADNLLDERPIISEGFGSFAPGVNGQGAARTTIRPRTVGISAAIRF